MTRSRSIKVDYSLQSITSKQTAPKMIKIIAYLLFSTLACSTYLLKLCLEFLVLRHDGDLRLKVPVNRAVAKVW